MYFVYIGEIGDVPSVKLGKDVSATLQGKASHTTSGRNWSKVHSNLFQRCVNNIIFKYVAVKVRWGTLYICIRTYV